MIDSILVGLLMALLFLVVLALWVAVTFMIDEIVFRGMLSKYLRKKLEAKLKEKNNEQ